ncbi:hypothetical protein GLOIN_2v1630138 [Rhizophagus clarus]|uniref:Uncharacterized protein n=1 Tax=Rhizophagus clarus TaxID=94130 RepID=A0A8H3M6J5_9GLOM|nr:hypothetical protein GLOIN_2v1630138 [Rhizophagus clarus]
MDVKTFAIGTASFQLWARDILLIQIVIQLPSQLYSNQEHSTSYSSNIRVSPPGNLPSIGEFLRSLDQRYNNDNVYFKFENSFLDEKIMVNVIKDSSDEQLTKLRVVKLGW